tara:strand:- start:859 stop:1869 length:1011 start_codon:yes stop_codon:yes gene_type:complete
MQAVVDACEDADGNQAAAARSLGIPRATFRARFLAAQARGIPPRPTEPFEADYLPGATPSAHELLERREQEWTRKDQYARARDLINVQIKIDGPIGIAHMGDPHIDDPGTNISKLRRHVEVINSTKGFFGANVGDQQNAWVGRLGHLHSQQSTSAAEAWVLVEWLVTSVQWLYLLLGNHDLWTGDGDPIQWMTRAAPGVTEPHGARLNLCFPNGKEVRINARHDFVGHSMWNTVHGPAKAVQMGWRDHILTCGHKHTSGYQVLKDPASGLVSHVIRAGGYKIHDRFAKERGLPNQNISPAFTTIIDPEYDDDDPRLITTIFDVEEAANFLTWKRSR